ncbi:MAG: hypothetical protein RLZZ236_1943 [Bacteroidota bacterium]|jgi:hypothetical protein
MTFLKKYWWILIIVFFLFSFKKKEEETEEESNILKIGEHSERVLRLQKWIDSKGYDIKNDGKFGIETGFWLLGVLLDLNLPTNNGINYHVVNASGTVWVDWIDINWLRNQNVGFN